MASVAVFTLPASVFPLGTVFKSLPDATVELERAVPVQSRIVPYIWIHGASVPNVERVFGEHPAFRNLEVVETIDDEHLVRVQWQPTESTVLKAILDTGVTLLSATGTATEWRFEIRAERHADVAEFERRCSEDGFPVDLVVFHPVASSDVPRPAGLTEKQRDALVAAHHRGYFATPREATLEDIAGDLGISRQALASRLRRGLFHVVGAMVGPADEES